MLCWNAVRSGDDLVFEGQAVPKQESGHVVAVIAPRVKGDVRPYDLHVLTVTSDEEKVKVWIFPFNVFCLNLSQQTTTRASVSIATYPAINPTRENRAAWVAEANDFFNDYVKKYTLVEAPQGVKRRSSRANLNQKPIRFVPPTPPSPPPKLTATSDDSGSDSQATEHGSPRKAKPKSKVSKKAQAKAAKVKAAKPAKAAKAAKAKNKNA
jgi:hypothetical protein